ncbi:type II secretion system protein N [Aliiglaciecola sp. 2_MG-2023]|uniref:type II secretion system protein N n=1 Tax=unclassified Aliiglaciecola TaxID=2593648 RepID=UPI0026E3A8EE|nr:MULTISPECIES: type II secretion system protein N [unclassified Aliiglaciecola]MDO6710037.1 type II secretion system protein N [Aliiglaciecola sp. 2_MG-2023]MDO6751185.1 type II secretion system protein N [Aliiglaciecola sp. 1_MG-2023]
MSNSNSNSKIILAILFIAIAVLCYVMFAPPAHEPIELSEEVKKELLNETGDIGMQQQQHPQHLQPEEQEIDLEGIPPSPLDISLIGVVASDMDTEASATIQSRLQIRTYFIDDQIAYTNAVIQEIRNDRVILLNEGQRQVLLLRGTASSDEDKGNTNTNSNSSNGYDQNSNDDDIAKSIGNRPKLLEHIIHISPFDQNDLSAGFNVSPGMNPKLYKSANFKQGDILQKINGNDITTEEGLEAVQTLLPTAQTLVFSVLRGGQVISLYLDIPSENLSIQKI